LGGTGNHGRRSAHARWTREERWRELYLQNVEQLWRTWLPSKAARGHLWTQDLHGRIEQLLGRRPRFAGKCLFAAAWRGIAAGGSSRTLYDRCVESLRATAMLEDDCANWPPVADADANKILLQWCHGAPGIVTGLSDFPRKRRPT
jgi:hypothetical protein